MQGYSDILSNELTHIADKKATFPRLDIEIIICTERERKKRAKTTKIATLLTTTTKVKQQSKLDTDRIKLKENKNAK